MALELASAGKVVCLLKLKKPIKRKAIARTNKVKIAGKVYLCWNLFISPIPPLIILTEKPSYTNISRRCAKII